VHCLDIYGALHRAPPFSPKKSLNAVVAEGTPSKSAARDAVQPKTSPFLNRSLRRALLTSPARPDRNGAEGEPNAAESQALDGAGNGSPQFKSCRSARASTLDYMTQIFPGRRSVSLLLYPALFRVKNVDFHQSSNRFNVEFDICALHSLTCQE
jgi:hypothetical protein